MIHGITTTCQTLGNIAKTLVKDFKCRVMLYDLYGRGFSDNREGTKHDAELYVSQARLVLESSTLQTSWTAKDARLRIIGYSLGGGIAIHLAAALGPAVESLVLLAPAGMIRPETFGLASRIVFGSGLVPGKLVTTLLRRRLQRPISAGVKQPTGSPGTPPSTASPSPTSGSSTPAVDPVTGGAAALLESVGAADLADAAMSETTPATVPLQQVAHRYVRWMMDNHPGFLPAVKSCFECAPLKGQQAAFKWLSKPGAPRTAFILGETDGLVVAKQYKDDVLPLVLGGRESGAVFWRVLEGDHNFPMTNEKATMEAIEQFWRGLPGE